MQTPENRKPKKQRAKQLFYLNEYGERESVYLVGDAYEMVTGYRPSGPTMFRHMEKGNLWFIKLQGQRYTTLQAVRDSIAGQKRPSSEPEPHDDSERVQRADKARDDFRKLTGRSAATV